MKPLMYSWILMMMAPHAVASTDMPMRIEYQDTTLTLCDQYTVRYALMIKVADAAWYSDDCDRTENLLDNPTKALKFVYHRDIPKDFFVEAANEFFAKNTTQTENQMWQSTLATFNANYSDIESNQSYELIQVDDCLTLRKEGTDQIRITQGEFANLYYRIWFGQKPAIKKLKQAFI